MTVLRAARAIRRHERTRTFDGRAAGPGLILKLQGAREPVAVAKALAPKEWSAMGASGLMSVVACCLLAGCGAGVQPGLANAPGLGGASPETRVHDAIANGHDACARAMFPEGGVLRGQVPPCTKENLRRPVGPTPSPLAEPSLERSHPFGFCPTPPQWDSPDLDKGLTAFPRSWPRLWLACEPPGSAGPSGRASPHM
jgi:hypothetical protein